MKKKRDGVGLPAKLAGEQMLYEFKLRQLREQYTAAQTAYLDHIEAHAFRIARMIAEHGQSR